jgi:hypothetical protein
VLRRAQERFADVAIAARGNTVALGFDAGNVEIVDMEGVTLRQWQTGEGKLRALALSPDGTRLVTTSGSTAKLWDTAWSQSLVELRGQDSAISSVAFSPDGKRVATGSADGTARLWDADTGALAFTVDTRQPVDSVGFIPNGGALATAGAGAVRIWNLSDGKLWRTLDGAVLAAVSRDGRLALTVAPGKGEARVANPRSGQFLSVLRTGGDVVAAAFIPGARRIAVATRDRGLQIWSTHWGAVLAFEHVLTLHADPGIRSILSTADGARLLGIYDNQVRIWDTRTAYSPAGFRSSPPAAPLVSTWSIALEVLAGGFFAMLIAGVFCFALFQRRQLEEAIFLRLAGIPAPPLPGIVARVGRWVARILGLLLALLFLVLAIAEDMPLLSRSDIRLTLGTLGFLLMTAGLILAWVQPLLGALCALVGYVLHITVVSVSAGNVLFLLVVAVSLLHILCWLRLRTGKPAEGPPQ